MKSIMTDLSDLTNEQLRAKGYIKGTEKKEQIISFLISGILRQSIKNNLSIVTMLLTWDKLLMFAAFFQQNAN